VEAVFAKELPLSLTSLRGLKLQECIFGIVVGQTTAKPLIILLFF